MRETKYMELEFCGYIISSGICRHAMDLKNWKVFQSLDPVFASNVRKAFVFGIGTNGSQPRAGLMVLKNDDVYVIAQDVDDIKLLGNEMQPYPRLPIKFQELCGKQVISVRSGPNHVVVRTKDGDICSWRESEWFSKPLAGSASEGKRVIQIACGNYHLLALNAQGEVYAWGANGFGQLGNGNTENSNDSSEDDDADEAQQQQQQYYENPVKITIGDEDVKIIQIACGDETSYALDKYGKVWSWGFSSEGALGYQAEYLQSVPRQVDGIGSTVAKIEAGSHHVLALCDNGVVYFWGQHSSEAVITKPKVMSRNLTTVRDIAATRACPISVCKTDTMVYFWGHWHGQFVSKPMPTGYDSMSLAFAFTEQPMMYRGVVFPEAAVLQPFIKKLEAIFDDSGTSDIIFEVEESFIFAIKGVLQVRSDHFRRMFEHDWRESCNNTVSIKIFSYEGFRAFLYYLYTNEIKWKTVENIAELIKLGDYYGEKDLQQRCENLLTACMTVDNVCEIYGYAVKYSAENLQNHVRAFMIPELNEVIKSEGYGKLDKLVVLQLMRKLAEEDAFIGLKRRRLD